MNCSIRTSIDFHTPYGNSSFVTFTGLPDNKEHFALIFKKDKLTKIPLVRLHSECITGDVFQSEHCDCGDQLNEALKIFSEYGGILLYLRQEGRGIGLYNKIDAYKLQSHGIDTFTANELLNFPRDLRDFEPAAAMLQALGITQIDLLSNNPNKKSNLEKFGVTINMVRNTGVFTKPKNKNYLQAKKIMAGHSIGDY